MKFSRQTNAGFVSYFLLPALLLAAGVYGLAARVTLLSFLVTLSTFLVFSFVGFRLYRRLVSIQESSIDAWVFGSVMGVTVGRLALILSCWMFGPRPEVIGAVLAGFVALGVLLRIRPAARTREDVSEAQWTLGIFVVMLILIAIPYWYAGRLTEGGYTFVPYFSKDFLNHISVSIELSRAVPPQSPYFAGQVLHYYWLFHSLPAATIVLNGTTGWDALCCAVPFNTLLFIASLVLTVRSFSSHSPSRYVAVIVGLIAPSYIWCLYAAKTFAPQLLQRLPIPTEFTGISHSWYRDFLYEPHAVYALTLVLFSHHIISMQLHQNCNRLFLGGFALGAALLSDAFIGIVGSCWMAAMLGWMILTRRVGFLSSVLAVLPTTFMGLLGWALGVFPAGGRPLVLAPHPMTIYAPAYLVLELGPIFILGTGGMALLIWTRNWTAVISLGTLAILALVFAFLIQMPLEQDIALRKGIKVVQIPLVVLSAFALRAVFDRPNLKLVKCLSAIAVAAGVLTILTDLHHYTNVTPNTLQVTPDQMRAYEWLRTQTTRDSTVQVLDEVRPGRKLMATKDQVIPALAERRTLFCNYELPYLFQVPNVAIQRRTAMLERVFTSNDSQEIHRLLKEMGLTYLYLDESRPGPLTEVFNLVRSGDLQEVFQAGSIRILLVR
jgi:hypothetical protein